MVIGLLPAGVIVAGGRARDGEIDGRDVFALCLLWGRGILHVAQRLLVKVAQSWSTLADGLAQRLIHGLVSSSWKRTSRVLLFAR